MSQITSNAKWVNRKSTKTTGDNLVMLTAYFAAGELANADDGTDWVNGEHVGLFEIPFGSTIHEVIVNVRTAAGGACTADLGVVGYTTYVGGAFSGSSTGADTDGLFDGLDLNSATIQRPTAAALIGRKLDETIFTDADEYGKPLYITMLGATVSTTPADSVVVNISVLVQTP